MSTELLTLLKRVQKHRQRFLPPTEEPPQPSVELRSLWERMENRRWRDGCLIYIDNHLEELMNELAFIDHVRDCEMCMVEMLLNVERYLGSRGPWYLDLRNDEFLSEEFPDCPKVSQYKIGCYGASSQDTFRFIKDRMNWAERKIMEQGQVVVEFSEAVEHWDLSGDPPVFEPVLFWF